MKKILSIFKKDTRPSIKRIKRNNATPFYIKRDPHDITSEYLDPYTPIKKDKE